MHTSQDAGFVFISSYTANANLQKYVIQTMANMVKVMHLMHPNAHHRTRQQERVWYLNLSSNDNKIWFEHLVHVNKCNYSYVYKLTVNGITLSTKF